jgi:hypothetical protein
MSASWPSTTLAMSYGCQAGSIGEVCITDGLPARGRLLPFTDEFATDVSGSIAAPSGNRSPVKCPMQCCPARIDPCLSTCNALHLRHALQVDVMTAPAERMRMMRRRRRARGVREVRLLVADARSRAVRRRVAKQVAALDSDHERDALKWIETVSEFDTDATR